MEGGGLSLNGPARLGFAWLGSVLLPKVGVWCRRDACFAKKMAFGIDETTLDFSNLPLV